MARIVCCGEGMLELRRGGDGRWSLGYGGDTLNTAIHLARSGHEVRYLTALGADAFSTELAQAWREEGLDTSLVLAHPVRQAGLYAITTDDAGERSFVYWRDSSAARDLFTLATDEVLDGASRADLFVFSLITLAIIPAAARPTLLDLARRVRRRGGQVAFDGNYRARLWSDAETARAARDAAIAVADIGLPTLDDEIQLGSSGNPAAVAEHWTGLGCGEAVVKLGPSGCLLPSGELIPPEAVLEPVDTSGAGDAFNAGYLGARFAGADPADAARAGHRLAAWTIMRAGAIPAAGKKAGPAASPDSGTASSAPGVKA